MLNRSVIMFHVIKSFIGISILGDWLDESAAEPIQVRKEHIDHFSGHPLFQYLIDAFP